MRVPVFGQHEPLRRWVLALAKSKSAARPLLLVTLLVASAGAGWLAVTAALPGRPVLSTLAADAAALPWAERAEDMAVEAARLAASAVETVREAFVSLAGGASALAEAAAPVIAQAATEAHETMRDPGTGPAIAGGLGLVAGLALGLQLGRRRSVRTVALGPADAAATAPPLATIAETPRLVEPAAERPSLPAAPLLAGTLPHRPALPDLTPPERTPAPAKAAEPDPRAALIEGVLRILAEETAATPGPEAAPRRVA